MHGRPHILTYWLTFPETNLWNERATFSTPARLAQKLRHFGRGLIKQGFEHNLNKQRGYKQTTRPITVVVKCRAKQHQAAAWGKGVIWWGGALWSEAGDPASVPLLNSMRTDFSLRGNPAANQRHRRNLWLICSEKSDQTWRLECIYRWTKLSVPNEERSKKLCQICLDGLMSYWFCSSPLQAKTASISFFRKISGFTDIIRWSVRGCSGPGYNTISGGCWILSSVCALIQ